MKKFLVRLILFSVCISLVFSTNVLFNSIYFSNNPFILNEKIDTVVTGNSSSMSAFNPEVMGNIANVSQGAEKYQFSYYKLRYLLEHNKNIKNIILSISPESFSE